MPNITLEWQPGYAPYRVNDGERPWVIDATWIRSDYGKNLEKTKISLPPPNDQQGETISTQTENAKD